MRFNAVGKYYVDPDLVQRLGFTGAVTIKVRYTWERNRVDNFAINNMTPYIGTPDGQLEGGNRALFHGGVQSELYRPDPCAICGPALVAGMSQVGAAVSEFGRPAFLSAVEAVAK